MPSLKDIRNRKKSVVSTKKITSAMKMIAAAKMRRAQERVVSSKVYADFMSETLVSLIEKSRSFESPPKLLLGTGREDRHLIIMLTSDRGLCGSFNSSVGRRVVTLLDDLRLKNNTYEVICIGRRGRDTIRASEFKDCIIDTYPAFDKPKFWQAHRVANIVMDRFEKDMFDVCTIIYNRFVSVISQQLTNHRLIPYTPLFPEESKLNKLENNDELEAIYEYDPSEQVLLDRLLPQNIAVQIYRAMLENAASENGARMTSMDSATRNANEMINKLELVYNRTRQAIVTKELIEIISGAEAL